VRVPGAGVIERDLEKDYESAPLEADKRVPAIQIDIPKERLELPEGKKIFIKQVQIKGNESISDKEICGWINGCIEQELALKDIYDLCYVIDQQYAKRGYF